MHCIECTTTNPDTNHFCGECGAELGHTLSETLRKKGLRDRHMIEMEITESVATRLMKWAGWTRNTVGVIVALFALLLGWSYLDVRKAVQAAKAEIDTAAVEAKSDINAVRQTTTGLKSEVVQLQSDIDSYKQVNVSIATVQKELTDVKTDVLDLRKKDVKVHTLETVGSPSDAGVGGGIGINELGCQPSKWSKAAKLLLCAQGSPPLFYQRAGDDVRPISSLSPVGFRDASTGTKPTCTAAARGTFYVEKGAGKIADKPFLCAKKSDNTYEWIQLAVVP
jgi:hypothetical protein